jgi:protein-S-isoprenylcysteine O-methyltransferase Ste14
MSTTLLLATVAMATLMVMVIFFVFVLLICHWIDKEEKALEGY